MEVDYVIFNANELVTFKGGSEAPLTKEKMEHLGIIPNGAVAIKGEKIVKVGKTEEVLRCVGKNFIPIDAKGKLVTPGLIDPHVHLVFAGSREEELELMAVKRVPYLEIKARGGGMPTTLQKTSETPWEEIIRKTKKILDTMLLYGTTTIEAKSGYEMSKEGEIRQLKVIHFLDKTHPIDLVPTFLAQGIPYSYENRVDKLTEEIVEEWLPEIVSLGLAEYCDVFCEVGYFNLSQSRKILEKGRELGLKLRIHADWLAHSGGAALGGELEVVSADHLIFTEEKEIEELVKKGVIGIFLPTTPFCYLGVYAKGREIIKKGLPIALGTDLSAANMCESMQMMMTLAVLEMKLTPAEALCGATINAAHSINRGKIIGSIEEGKIADIVIFDAKNHKFFPYHYGVNLVDKVFKRGKLVVEEGKIKN